MLATACTSIIRPAPLPSLASTQPPNAAASIASQPRSEFRPTPSPSMKIHFLLDIFEPLFSRLTPYRQDIPAVPAWPSRPSPPLHQPLSPPPAPIAPPPPLCPQTAVLAFFPPRNYTGLLPDRSHEPVGASPLFCWARRMVERRCVNARGACGRATSRAQFGIPLAGQYWDS